MKVRLKIRYRGRRGYDVSGVPFKKLEKARKYRKKRWELEDGWLILEAIAPEEEPLLGFTFAEIQDLNPYLADYIWWVQNAFALPGFTYPAIFVIPLAWFALRNRQRWAWYTILIPNLAFWLLFYAGCRVLHPAQFGSVVIGAHWAFFTPFFILFLIGIILPARQILAQKDAEGNEFR